MMMPIVRQPGRGVVKIFSARKPHVRTCQGIRGVGVGVVGCSLGRVTLPFPLPYPHTPHPPPQHRSQLFLSFFFIADRAVASLFVWRDSGVTDRFFLSAFSLLFLCQPLACQTEARLR